MPDLEVVTVGTGSPLPDPSRAGPSNLVLAGEVCVLFDCGRGVLLRTAAVGIGAGRLDALMLTHLHSDHITDLSDVVTTRWITTFAPSPLRVFGPVGTQDVVDGILASLAHDIEYRISHHGDLPYPPAVEVTEVSDGVVFDEGGLRVIAGPTDHRPVAPTVGYRAEYDGHSIVLAGDTVPCDGLDALAQGADVLVHTVIRPEQLKAIGLPRLVDVCDYHSSIEQAAGTATRAGVRKLVLTHCVPPIAPGGETEWRDIAAEHFAGEIVVAADLDRVPAA